MHKVGRLLEHKASPLSTEFYHKYLFKSVLALLLLYSYTEMRFIYEQYISEIGQLKTELADVRYTSIATWGELTSKNKPETVRRQITQSANLVAADEPPIEVD